MWNESTFESNRVHNIQRSMLLPTVVKIEFVRGSKLCFGAQQ